MQSVCNELYAGEDLMPELQRALLDTEAKAAAMSNKRNVILNFEKEIEKAIYRNEQDAILVAMDRARRFNDYLEPEDDDFVE